MNWTWNPAPRHATAAAAMIPCFASPTPIMHVDARLRKGGGDRGGELAVLEELDPRARPRAPRR